MPRKPNSRARFLNSETCSIKRTEHKHEGNTVNASRAGGIALSKLDTTNESTGAYRWKHIRKLHHYFVVNPRGNMASLACGNGEEIPSWCPQQNLEWSLRPIFIGLRVLGIDFDANQPRSLLRRCTFISLAVVLFLISCCLNIINNVHHVELYRTEFSTESVYMLIYFGWLTVSNIAFACALMAVSQLRWGKLWRKLQRIEQFNSFTARSYGQTRKLATVLAIVSVLLVILHFVFWKKKSLKLESFCWFLAQGVLDMGAYYLTLQEENYNYFTQIQNDAVDKIFGRILPEIGRFLTSALFMSLIYSVSMSIQVLIEEAETYLSTTEHASIHRLVKWSKDYLFILDVVDEISHFFAILLLIMFASLFLTTTIFSFRFLNVVLTHSRENSVRHFMKIVKNIIIITGMIHPVEMMKRKVSSPSYSSGPSEFENRSLIAPGFEIGQDDGETQMVRPDPRIFPGKILIQFSWQIRPNTSWFPTSAQTHQMDLLIIKINQNIPRISPMGMFEVSSQIFPSVYFV